MEQSSNKKAVIVKSFCLVVMILTMAFGIILLNPNDKVDTQGVVLKQGSSGAQVKTLQSKLNAWGYNAGKVDGIFGATTTAAVKKFQSKNKLTADGIVGKSTAAALGLQLVDSGSTNSGYGGSNEYLLAKCVYAESRGEPYIGQVAVAAIVLNRVRDSRFPNSIAGVIYQPYAFTAVADGQINLTPNQSAFNAARDALKGWDPTNGCVYYYNPSTATSAWI
ncbi:MAG: spore cortex-lytic enzyme, partial [Clostridia bacterium]